MALDPKVKELLTAIAAAGLPSIDSIPLEAVREMVEKGYAAMRIPVMAVGSIRNRSFSISDGKIDVRIYIPRGEGPFPVMVFFHGGGWVLFHLDAYDPICSIFVHWQELSWSQSNIGSLRSINSLSPRMIVWKQPVGLPNIAGNGTEIPSGYSWRVTVLEETLLQ